MMHIYIDDRMAANSGIGVYLVNITRAIGAFLTRSAGFVFSSYFERNRGRVPPRIYGAAEQIVMAWESRGSDVMWCPHYNIPILASPPLVVTIHDCAHLALPEIFPGFLKRLYAWGLFTGVALRGSAIICVSQFTATELVRRFPVLRKRVAVIYNGVDPKWFGVARRRRRVGPGRGYFLCVGNVKPHKNYERLVTAFLRCTRAGEYELVVAGKCEGFLTQDSSDWRSRSARSGRVTFCGEVSAERLEELYAGAEAFLFPSLYEGFGLPLLEALACGCPAIASSIPPFREIAGGEDARLSENGAVVYFDPESVGSMEQAIGDYLELGEERGQCMVRIGRQRAQNYEWTEAARRTGSVIAAVGAYRVV